MKIYNYNPENGYFVGESLADESPLEPSVYLVPAHSTTIPAPKPVEGKLIVWIGNGWELQDSPVIPIADNSKWEAQQAQAKAALLAQLGITEEQAKLLLS